MPLEVKGLLTRLRNLGLSGHPFIVSFAEEVSWMNAGVFLLPADVGSRVVCRSSAQAVSTLRKATKAGAVVDTQGGYAATQRTALLGTPWGFSPANSLEFLWQWHYAGVAVCHALLDASQKRPALSNEALGPDAAFGTSDLHWGGAAYEQGMGGYLAGIAEAEGKA